MYTSFKVENYRCFKKLDLEKLARINLIAGKNNVGKTALLEAIMIHSGNYDPRLILRIQSQRDSRLLSPSNLSRSTPDWNILFSGFDVSEPISFEGTHIPQDKLFPDTWKVELEVIVEREKWANNDQISNLLRRLQRDYDVTSQDIKILKVSNSETSNPNYLAIYEDRVRRDVTQVYHPYPLLILPASQKISPMEDAQRFSDLIKARKIDLLLSTLTVVEPRIKSLELLVDGIYGDIGLKEPVPLTAMGDGINRITSLVLAISNASNGIVLVDEIENGLHYSVLKDVWKAISRASHEFNVQIFATTHSLECIRAAHEAFEEGNINDFRYHRLDRTRSDEIRVVSYDEEVMEAAIEANSEVR